MEQVLLIGGILFVAYLVVGQMRQNDFNNAIQACGGPIQVGIHPNCPQMIAAQQKWAWYPTFTVSL